MIQKTLDQAIEKVRLNIPRYGDEYPHNGEGNKYILTENNHWMTSFWPGQLWLAYHLTGDNQFRTEAERHLANFKHRVVNRIHESHDLGFLYSLTARAQWQITQDEEAREVGIYAAERLATRFLPKGEYIQAWGAMNDPEEGGRMIVDCLMNLPLLFWASHETNDPKFADVASKHAQTTLKYVVRDGDHTYHTFFFNQATGEPVGGKTAQGYSDDSLWSRGQAWAIYGFALAAEWMNDRSMLDVAIRLADRFWVELGDAPVPLWDFRVPPDGPQKRDSSAGAIAACGLFKLASLVGDGDHANIFKKRAESITTRLIDACFETSPDAEGQLRDSTYNANKGVAVEQFMPFGDYFFLESLVMMSEKPIDFWGTSSLDKH